jgi:ornithine cyclodeaminase
VNPASIDAAATRAALPFPALVDALRRAFAAGAEVPLRHAHALSGGPTGAGGTLLLMPAWRPGGRGGVKTVAIFPANAEAGLPTLHSTYLLFDAATGAPLAFIDGDEITARRTAAASALAASFLARPDARRLLVVGAGRVAALMPEAMGAVRGIAEVVVAPRPPRLSPAGSPPPASRRPRRPTCGAACAPPTSSAARRWRRPRWSKAPGCARARTST